MRNKGLKDDQIPKSLRTMELQILRRGTTRETCHLAAGLGQELQRGADLSDTQVMIYLYHISTSRPAGAQILNDDSLYYHLRCAGYLTRERREKAGRSRAGKLRTDEETELALV
jgi:hypothetical protein